MRKQPKIQYVSHISDLMNWRDYEVVSNQKTVRFRLTVTEQGLEIIGDSPYPHLLDELLEELDLKLVQMMLCG